MSRIVSVKKKCCLSRCSGISLISLGLPQLTVFTYLIYWLYEDKKPVSKKIPNLKQENQRDYQVLFTGFTSIKNA